MEKIDQFGRSNKNPSTIIDDKSKKILEALNDIKNQIQNDKEFKEPTIETSETNTIEKNNPYVSEFIILNNKIESLEKKINQFVENLQNNQKGFFKKDEDLDEEDQSIFHKIENNNSDQKQSKSMVVLENQDLQNISSFKFYHFLILLIILSVVLILITSSNLELTIPESLNFFLRLFS